MKKLWPKENKGVEIGVGGRGGGGRNGVGLRKFIGLRIIIIFFYIYLYKIKENFFSTLFLLQCSSATMLWLLSKLLSYEPCEIL